MAWLRSQGVRRSSCPRQEFLGGVDGEESIPKLDQEQRAQFFFDWGVAVGRLHAEKTPCFSNSISDPERCCRSWTDLVCERLERLIPSNRAAGIVGDSELNAMESAIYEAAKRLSNVTVPALVHCDLYPPNTLVSNGRFTALLDFEHAKFMDPVFDFVKLGMWVFEPIPDAAGPFWDGYVSSFSRADRFQERLWVCVGLELLAGFPYWKRRGEVKLMDDYRSRLRQWFAEM